MPSDRARGGVNDLVIDGEADVQDEWPRKAGTKSAGGERRQLVWIGASALFLLVLLGAVASVVSPETYGSYDPSAGNLSPNLALPGDARWRYLLGTDSQGHSILMWVAFGARLSLLVPFVSALVACAIGLLLTRLEEAGERLRYVITFLIDLIAILPALLLLCILLVYGVGSSVWLSILLFALISCPWQRGRLSGATRAREAAHFMQRVMTVTASLIVMQAGIDFLGFGLQPALVTWGDALRHCTDYMASGNWWWPFFPGVAITWGSVSAAILARGLAPIGERYAETPPG